MIQMLLLRLVVNPGLSFCVYDLGSTCCICITNELMLLGKQIVLKDFVDDDTVNGNDITELPEDDSNEGLRGGHDNKEDAPIQNTSSPAEKNSVYTGPHQDERYVGWYSFHLYRVKLTH